MNPQLRKAFNIWLQQSWLKLRWKIRNPERHSEVQRAWYARNREAQREVQRARYWKKRRTK